MVSGGGLGVQLAQQGWGNCVGPKAPHNFPTFIEKFGLPDPFPDTHFVQLLFCNYYFAYFPASLGSLSFGGFSWFSDVFLGFTAGFANPWAYFRVCVSVAVFLSTSLFVIMPKYWFVVTVSWFFMLRLPFWT